MAVILVTGGAGYIGAHTCLALATAGHFPVTLDNLSKGHREAVRWGPLVHAAIADREAVKAAIAAHKVEALIHFAGAIEAGLSMREPARFYDENVVSALSLLAAAREAGVTRVVFSSSAAVYGEPKADLLREDHPLLPVNTYGETKLAIERALHWFAQAGAAQYAALRYFNAAGAAADSGIGEDHEPETHVIPLAIAAALGTGLRFRIFGTDYATPDGTALRDYVHVMDLARAHVAAVERLLKGGDSLVANLGSGTGHSVRAVVDAVARVTGREVPFEIAPRRPGDPARLVADIALAKRELGWQPEQSGLDEIVASAFAWHRR